MKRLLIFAVLLFFVMKSFSQVPEGFNYQAVARDANGNVRSNEFIELRFTLQAGYTGTPTWIETHSGKTDVFGIFTVTIGSGTKTGGTATAFKDLDFTKGDYWIKVEVKDGANYVQIGNLQNFLSVPYALVSKTTLDKDDADADSTNEIQFLNFSNDTLYLSNGGFVYLGNYDNTTTLSALLLKIISDSTYLKQLIDLNDDEILSLQGFLNDLATKHDIDSAYLHGLINTNASTINNEKTDRINADNGIKTKHSTDSILFIQAIQTVNVNLNTETTNRVAADNTIKAKATTDSTLFKSLNDNLSAGLTSEITNRTNADNVLRSKQTTDSTALRNLINTYATNLTTETSARIAGDNTNKTKQASDSTYFEGKIKTVETNISTETTNRIAADNSIKNKVVSDSSFLTAGIKTVSDNLNTETANRVNADNTIKTKHNTDSAIVAQNLGTLNNSLSIETTARIASDNSIKSKQTIDSSCFEGKVKTNETNLNTEITNRINADNVIKTKHSSDSTIAAQNLGTLSNNLSTETTARISSDNSIKNKQTIDSTYFEGKVKTNETNLNTETTNRINADNVIKTKHSTDSAIVAQNLGTLSNNLSTETTARIAGDNANKTKQTNDSTYFKGEINTVTTNLNTETTNRITVDNAIKSKNVTDSTALRNLINTNSTSLTAETTARIAGDNANKTKQATDSTALRNLINTNTTNLSTETTARIAGDNAIKTKQNSDSTCFGGQIQSLDSELATETSSRIAYDNTLMTKINTDSTYLKGKIDDHVAKDIDTSSTNELQALIIIGDTIFLSNGGFVKLPSEKQTLSNVISNGNSANGQIKNLSAPTDSNDAATKAYVDKNATQKGTKTGEMHYWDGKAWVALPPGTTGKTLTFCDSVPHWGPCPPIYAGGSVFCGGNPTAVVDVTNPVTGKTWMDRNLGASKVADSINDVNASGDLYQWGRRADGHQCRNSFTTTTLSSIDTPAHGYFIIAPNYPEDWRNPQNANLWQGVNGINNPCPNGYRLPTETEWDLERQSWVSNNATGAFGSPLKLPGSGSRRGTDGYLNPVGTTGDYLSSTVSGINSRILYFSSSNAFMASGTRASGFSVRCIKNY